jgi:hypothetical protein
MTSSIGSSVGWMILLTLAAALHLAAMEPAEIVGTWRNPVGCRD